MIKTYSAQLEQEGYYIARNFLDPQRDIQIIKDAYTQLMDVMAKVYLHETNDLLLEVYQGASFPERAAMLWGFSGGKAYQHIAPAVHFIYETYQWQPELPSAQFSELFELMCHPKILDEVEQHLGGEIIVSPSYQFNLKWASQHLDIATSLASEMGISYRTDWLFETLVGQTPWHSDVGSVMKNAQESKSMIVWIPLTEANDSNGCLQVIPGSHKKGVRSPPLMLSADEKSEAVSLVVEVGDVVFMDIKTHHSSLANTSQNQHRWALNFRYLPTGQTWGRPFLPAFVARSRAQPETELHNSILWSEMWCGALRYREKNGPPLGKRFFRDIGLHEARAITRHWNNLIPNHDAWLKL